MYISAEEKRLVDEVFQNAMQVTYEQYIIGFLGKVVRHNDTDVTSFFMQFKKLVRGLLREVFQSKGEWVVGLKRGGGGGNKKASVLKNSVNTEAISINKNECSVASCVFLFLRICGNGLETLGTSLEPCNILIILNPGTTILGRMPNRSRINKLRWEMESEHISSFRPHLDQYFTSIRLGSTCIQLDTKDTT